MTSTALLTHRAWIALVALSCASAIAQAAPIVPGTGQKLEIVGDDFEDPEWKFIPNLPKSSLDLDKQTRNPAGYSKNGRWRENLDRGQPDVVRIIETPEGGLPDSVYSLLIASRDTGIPGKPTGKGEQDDLFMSISPLVGRYIPVSQGPSMTVRVYLRPFEEWENRTGSSFAFRATCRGEKADKDETEPYWPGIFINHKRDRDRRKNEAPANLVVRAMNSGGDYGVMPIKEPGWWTFGMSFSPDGQIHYYAHPGVEELTSADRIASHNPYNFRTLYLIDCFFDVFGGNNGQTWTTGWVIDDPAVYLAYPPPKQQARQRKPQRTR